MFRSSQVKKIERATRDLEKARDTRFSDGGEDVRAIERAKSVLDAAQRNSSSEEWNAWADQENNRRFGPGWRD